jgi:hypothetical protein
VYGKRLTQVEDEAVYLRGAVQMMYQRMYPSDAEEGSTSEGEHRRQCPGCLPRKPRVRSVPLRQLLGNKRGGQTSGRRTQPLFSLIGGRGSSLVYPRGIRSQGESGVNAKWLAADAEMCKMEREREEADLLLRVREPRLGAGRGDLTGRSPLRQGEGGSLSPSGMTKPVRTRSPNEGLVHPGRGQGGLAVRVGKRSRGYVCEGTCP